MNQQQFFDTQGFNGYSVQYSPYFKSRLACASSANYGIVGNGRLWILDFNAMSSSPATATTMGSSSSTKPIAIYDTQDVLFDCCWSENHENHIVASSGDGSIKLWDVTLRDHPARHWKEHDREVFSVHWNLVRKDSFVSGSWDRQIKVWSPQSPHSLLTFAQEHTECIYATIWSPSRPDSLISCSGDSSLKLWDVRSPQHSSLTIPHSHQGEVLSVDWNKYSPDLVVSVGVDKSVRIWDIKFCSSSTNSKPLMIIPNAHEYAIRRVKCSPHSPDIFATASYDMTWKLWYANQQNATTGITNTAAPPLHPHTNPTQMHSRVLSNRPSFVYDGHSEFVVGLDFNLFQKGRIVSCSWDRQIHSILV